MGQVEKVNFREARNGRMMGHHKRAKRLIARARSASSPSILSMNVVVDSSLSEASATMSPDEQAPARVRLFRIVSLGEVSNPVLQNADKRLINVRDSRGRTPLMIAVLTLRGQKLRAMVEALLKLGADPELKDWDGVNAILMCIVKRRSREIISLMAEKRLEAA